MLLAGESGETSSCVSKCGDGIKTSDEGCDDGGRTPLHFQVAKERCESRGSTLITDLTLLETLGTDVQFPIWIGATERDDMRGSFVLLDGTELSHDHPAWGGEGDDKEPNGDSSYEDPPALCVGFIPGYGLFDNICDLNLLDHSSTFVLCQVEASSSIIQVPLEDDGDGCSSFCTVEAGFVCDGMA